MIALIKHNLSIIKYVIIAFVLGVVVLGLLVKWDYNSNTGDASFSTARIFTFLIYILVLGSVMKIGKFSYKNKSKEFMSSLPITNKQVITIRFLLTLSLSILGGIIVYITIPLYGFDEYFVAIARNYLVFSVLISLLTAGMYYMLLDKIGYKKLFPISWTIYFILVVLPSVLRTVAKKFDSDAITQILNYCAQSSWLLELAIAVFAYIGIGFLYIRSSEKSNSKH